MSSRSLGALTLDLVARTGSLEQGMGRAAQTVDTRSKQMERSMNRVGKAIAAASAAIAAGLAVAVRGAINDMDNLAKAAQRTGLSVEELSALQFAGTLSGVENLEGALRSLQRAAGQAAQGSRAQAEAFEALNVEVKDSEGNLRSLTAIMGDVADRFRSLPDGPEKTFIATRLRIQEMIPLLNQGSEGIRALTDEADALGVTVDTKAAKAAEEFNDNLSRLRAVSTAFARQLATELLPDLVNLSQRFSDSSANGEKVRNTVEGVANTIRVLTTLVQTLAFAFQTAGRTIGAVAANIENNFRFVQEYGSSLSQGGLLTSGGRDSLQQALTRRREAERAIREGLAEDVSASFRELGDSIGPALDRIFGRVVEGAEDASESTEALTETNEELRRSLQRYVSDQEAANKATAAASRAQRDAEREAQRIQDAGIAAGLELDRVLRQQADTLGGPLVQAANAYADQMLSLVMAQERLTEANLLDESAQLRLNIARERAGQIYQDQLSAIQDQVGPVEQMLEDMRFELSLMGMTNLEREKEIALRWAGAEATEEQKRQITDLIDIMDAERERIEQLDGLRNTFEGFFSSILEGSKSAKDAFKSLADDLIRQMVRIQAQKMTESLFGQMGTGGGGSAGGWASMLGSLFGGNREFGGRVDRGRAYVVGERRPEVFVPDTAGTIVPSVEGGGMAVTNNFHYQAPPNRSTQVQTAARTGFEIRRLQRLGA